MLARNSHTLRVVLPQQRQEGEEGEEEEGKIMRAAVGATPTPKSLGEGYEVVTAQ